MPVEDYETYNSNYRDSRLNRYGSIYKYRTSKYHLKMINKSAF